jgi:hypothetical protein
MGGPRSGRWGRRTRRATVEACISIDATRWQQEGILQPGCSKTGSQTWTDPVTGVLLASIRYEVNTRDAAHPWLELSYSLPGYTWGPGPYVRYMVDLVTTGLHFGGLRWWFRCPLVGLSGPCGRRVQKLHYYGSCFGCRQCHRLTYTSCQRAHRAERLIGRVAQIQRQIDIIQRGLASAQRRFERPTARR